MSLSIAAAAVVVGPAATWFLTNRQLQHAKKMQEVQQQHEREKQKLELEFRSRREWADRLREQVAALIAASYEVSTYGYSGNSSGIFEIGSRFTNAQTQILLLVGSSTTHRELRALTLQLGKTVRNTELSKSKLAEAIDEDKGKLAIAAAAAISECYRPL